jgi:NADH:ubiquinone oxidoreductase subunit 2 (subunit N)
MEFLTLLNNALFFNICIFVIGFYLASVLCFGIRFSSASELAYPNLLYCFTLFSFFCLLSLLCLFCFDFIHYDSSYFFNQNIQFLFLLIACCISFVSRDFLTAQLVTKFEYDLLFLFVVFSGLCLCFTDDFLIMYLAIELQSLAFYVFASFQRNSEYSTEAGLKYFIFGAIISCFLLLGFSFVYLSFGTTSFELLFSIAISQNDNLLFCGILFILVALLFKVGSAPFHS